VVEADRSALQLRPQPAEELERLGGDVLARPLGRDRRARREVGDVDLTGDDQVVVAR
jgi:hypothetical protein